MMTETSTSASNNDLPPPRLHITPPLLNSANPWATTLEDLRQLYNCASTGAVTTRTALLDNGFAHDDATHRFAFFSTTTSSSTLSTTNNPLVVDASINTLGYSPIPLAGYLEAIRTIVSSSPSPSSSSSSTSSSSGGDSRKKKNNKPFIISIAGDPIQVAEAYRRVARAALDHGLALALELNLSCPNIPGHPPPAYSRDALREYIRAVADAAGGFPPRERIPWGVKTPPYTHAGQFEMVVSVLAEFSGGCGCGVGFVTAVNTLGSCILPAEGEGEDEGGMGIGGVAGAPLHPLALGNVAALRRLMDRTPGMEGVDVLGVGGVGDAVAYRRMRRVGAAAVGVGTALGIRGVGVFGEIERGLDGVWDV